MTHLGSDIIAGITISMRVRIVLHTEMEVTENFTESQETLSAGWVTVVGFFLGYIFLNPKGLVFFRWMIQYNQKSIYQPIDFKNPKKNQTKPKVSRLLSNVKKKARTLGRKPYHRDWIWKSIAYSLWIFILCDFHLCIFCHHLVFGKKTEQRLPKTLEMLNYWSETFQFMFMSCFNARCKCLPGQYQI